MATAGDRTAMTLLDLPVDVLKDIIKHLTHTNDLAAVALTHSALHRLATPQIYSRFDIVWPDGAHAGEPRGGVDALTYGLATLTMADDVFGEASWQREKDESEGVAPRPPRRRRGNHYAQYIRKFSLGNGPWEWVEDYLTNKEQGKMLGTLVALALPRMRSLESFVWDMPTGILNDVWTSLSYLGERGVSGEPCRLEKVWVRWHRNDILFPATPPAISHAIPRRIDQSNALARVVHPSFSGLPPLKSLSVVDIDELQYLDEMSVLIGKSLEKLRELRVGIAFHSRYDDWTVCYDGDGYEQIDYANPIRSTATIGSHRRGGIAGVLVSAFLDLKQTSAVTTVPQKLRRRSGAVPLLRSLPVPLLPAASNENIQPTAFTTDPGERKPGTAQPVPVSPTEERKNPLPEQSAGNSEGSDPPHQSQRPEPAALRSKDSTDSMRLTEDYPRRLQLEILELERVTLSIPALSNALDWSKLTTLTLLGCPAIDELWTALIGSYARQIIHNGETRAQSSPGAKRSARYLYALNIRTIHLNTVSPTFLNFVTVCLAPNSLDSIFLQDNSREAPSVTIDQIFTSVVKRHKTSIKRLAIDSCKRKKGLLVSRSTAWKRWALSLEHLRFVMSGKMPALRELGICIEHSKHWHFFVQHLPALPRLRSLYIPRYTSHRELPAPGPKELAMQLLDAVSFNRDMELCYVGIYDKCFELLEGDPELHEEARAGTNSSPHVLDDTSDEDDDEDDDDDDDVDDDDEDDGDNDPVHDGFGAGAGAGPATPAVTSPAVTAGSNGAALDFLTDSEADSELAESVVGDRLHIREILFYDDKVPVFRVRHGRL